MLSRLAPAACLAAALAAGAAEPPVQVSALADLSLEQLGAIRVTSVSRRAEPLATAAASIHVITAEDIRRSAATTLPEALRLAPNLQVARANAGQYAISARGFNEVISNKLLVLVDGRTVYSPLFSGVFWDANDLVLQDIERIEVISGPGATLYGANAVNGVINVITRPARETQGTLAHARAGAEGSQLTLRHGRRLGDDAHLRLYATRLDRDATRRVDGGSALDDATKEQIGFRLDRASDSGDRYTLQGDAYHARGDGASTAPRLTGGNLLARWRREAGDGSAWQLQAYLDQERREDVVVFTEKTRTFDLELTRTLAPIGRHTIVWGLGHRLARNETEPTALVRFIPQDRTLHWSNVFVQDEIQLGEPLRVTVGAKLERNTYTGLEVLPTLRAAYAFDGGGVLWGALSRAVRAPARLDRDFFLPATPPFLIQGGPDFDSETVEVGEIGWRDQPTPALRYALTAFVHAYDRLRGGTSAPTVIGNRAWGETYGLEGWGQWQVRPGWRLRAGFVELRKSLEAQAGSGPNTVENLGNDPEHQWMLGSRADLPGNVEFDLTLRHVSALPQPRVEAYTSADLRLAWRPQPRMALALLVHNAVGDGQVEFGAAPAASHIPRSAYLSLELQLD